MDISGSAVSVVMVSSSARFAFSKQVLLSAWTSAQHFQTFVCPQLQLIRHSGNRVSLNYDFSHSFWYTNDFKTKRSGSIKKANILLLDLNFHGLNCVWWAAWQSGDNLTTLCVLILLKMLSGFLIIVYYPSSLSGFETSYFLLNIDPSILLNL